MKLHVLASIALGVLSASAFSSCPPREDAIAARRACGFSPDLARTQTLSFQTENFWPSIAGIAARGDLTGLDSRVPEDLTRLKNVSKEFNDTMILLSPFTPPPPEERVRLLAHAQEAAYLWASAAARCGAAYGAVAK
jgi:hypothetical protein